MINRPRGLMFKKPLHFIWIVDCSGSMSANGKIQAVNNAIREVISHMRNEVSEDLDFQVLMRAITFSSGARWHIADPTPIEHFKWDDIYASRVTNRRDMGEALTMVGEEMKRFPERAFPPVLVLISDGQPTDNFAKGLAAIMDQGWGKKAVRLAIAIGEDADMEILQQFIGDPEIKPLQANNPEALTRYIKWYDYWYEPITEEDWVTKNKTIPFALASDVTNKKPRQALCQIIYDYGQDVARDTKRCKALQLDLCGGEHRREIRVLVIAMEERVASELLSPQNVPNGILLPRLVKRLHEDAGIATEFAQWAVETWALALGVIREIDLMGVNDVW